MPGWRLQSRVLTLSKERLNEDYYAKPSFGSVLSLKGCDDFRSFR